MKAVWYESSLVWKQFGREAIYDRKANRSRKAIRGRKAICEKKKQKTNQALPPPIEQNALRNQNQTQSDYLDP
jgi:hypothetical protein